MKILIAILSLMLLSTSNSTKLEEDYVTIGSTVKLVNQAYKVRLHSHDVKYGTGSGQQSVTGMKAQDDANSYWQVRSPTDEHLARGTPIKCGQSVRLTHLKTLSNLHSHHFGAPMSSGQEVSCFGEDGAGDHLDDWIVVCSETYWERTKNVQFRHKETRGLLACSSKVYGRPIQGQQEVLATGNGEKSSNTFWKTMEAIILRPSENMGSV